MLLLVYAIFTAACNSLLCASVHAHEHGADVEEVYKMAETPAMWGDSVPDYSAVHLESSRGVYLYALVFVDLKISDYYRRDLVKIKSEVMKLVGEANKYFYQVGVHLVIVDVIETWRNDLSLYSFEEYRNKRIHDLPYHNFAALLSYRYAGGLAFVNGMCSIKSVMLAGFYPHNPEAMGSIFFHEVSHLIGVPHTPFNQTLTVPNCGCEQNLPDLKEFSQPLYRPHADLGPGVENNDGLHNHSNTRAEEPRQYYQLVSPGCLRIPGFDHNCTLQLMTNLLYRNRCLLREPYNGENQPMHRHFADQGEGSTRDSREISSIALCGNGYREEFEECDCGLEESCWLANCNPSACERLIADWIIWLAGFALLFASVVAISICYHYYLLRRHISKFPYSKRNNSFDIFGHIIEFVEDQFLPTGQLHIPNWEWRSIRGLTEKLPGFRRVPRSMSVEDKEEALDSKLCLQVGTLNRNLCCKLTPPVSLRGSKLNTEDIVVIRSPDISGTTSRLTMNSSDHRRTERAQRPGRPPPPPPSINGTPALSSPGAVSSGPSSYRNTLPRRPTIPPPPHPSTIPRHSKLIQSDPVERQCYIKSGSGGNAELLKEEKKLTPPLKIDDDRYSISHKFADFDDEDFDSDFDENFGQD